MKKKLLNIRDFLLIFSVITSAIILVMNHHNYIYLSSSPRIDRFPDFLLYLSMFLFVISLVMGMFLPVRSIWDTPIFKLSKKKIKKTDDKIKPIVKQDSKKKIKKTDNKSKSLIKKDIAKKTEKTDDKLNRKKEIDGLVNEALHINDFSENEIITFLYFMVIMGKVDGEFDLSERKIIYQQLNELFLEEPTTDYSSKLLLKMQNKTEEEHYKVLFSMSEAKQNRLLISLLKVADADGISKPSEEKLFNEIQTKFNNANATVKAIDYLDEILLDLKKS